MSKRTSKSKPKTRTAGMGEEMRSRIPLPGDRDEPDVEADPRQRQSTDAAKILRGSVLYYERPFDPVGEDDWEALSEP